MARYDITPIENPNKILNYWKNEKKLCALIIIFGLSFNIMTIFGPIYQGKLLDSIIENKKLSDVLILVSVFLFLILFIQISRYFKRYYIRKFANKTQSRMRMMIYNDIMNMKVLDLANENIGNLMARSISDVDICAEGMRKFSTEIFDTGVLMVSYIIAMMTYDIKITLLGIIFVPLAMYLAERLKKIIYRYTKQYRRKASEIADFTYDLVDNSTLYRLNGVEEKNTIRYENNLAELESLAIKANLLENSMQPIYNAIALIGIVFVIYLAGMKVIDGADGWSVGVFSTYIIMFLALAIKAAKAAKLFNTVQKSKISWIRIKPYLNGYSQKAEKTNLEFNEINLIVKNLDFNYFKNKEFIIKDISFTAKEGDIIGITGPVASGKSSLAIALTGLYDYIGSIMINNKELNQYTDYEKSLMISYLSHKSQLFSDTIYNNITFGLQGDISNIIIDADLAEDINAMNDGVNTLIGNGGVNLSGGQKQRVALARALYQKKKIIILDEPFSAIDLKTENKIIGNLRKNYQNSIIIIVSHRLAIFSLIDKVLFLNNDKSYLFGTHEELLEKSEIYRTIYAIQNRRKGDDLDEKV